jgi:flagellar hook-associated protein 2
MSITSTGLISGLDTQAIINSLLQVAARPRQLAEERLVGLQFIQTAYLDVNSALLGLETASANFRTQNTFNTRSAISSDTDVINATASAGAPEGTFSFLVDRLVSTQQLLGRGFASLNESALGASENLVFDSSEARLDRNTELSELNNGAGIERGTITISDGTNSAEIDLSRAGTVDEVLDAINANTSINVTASVEDGSFVLTGATSVTDAPGGNTARDLGLEGAAQVSGAITGSRVYGINENTTLASLNDGRGVDYDNLLISETRSDFQIVVNDGTGDTIVNVNLGSIFELNDGGDDDDDEGGFNTLEGPVSTVGGTLNRINDALTEAGFGDVAASVNAATGAIEINSANPALNLTVQENPTGGRTTAADLGLLGSGANISGSRIFAEMNTTLTSSLNGGSGIGGDGTLTVTDRNGNSTTVTGLGSAETTDDLLRSINDQLAGAGVGVTFGIGSNGIGFSATDTSGGSSNLIIEGTNGDDTAQALGISTGAGGVASSAFKGDNLQLGYIGTGTLVSSLRNGQGIGTGTFTITDSLGATADIQIDGEVRTLGEVIDRINSEADVAVTARINDTGDGIIIEEDAGTNGSVAISISDDTGSVAKNLNLVGTASGTGADNTLNGSFERVVEIEATDTLQDIVSKINDAGVGVDASVVNTGSGSTPFRLSLTSETAGSSGRFVFDSGSFDFGLTTLNEGNDARLFFGSDDPAQGVLISSSTNTFDSIVSGLSIEATSTSDTAVEVSVSQDTANIEAGINAFISAFNNVIDRIDSQSRFIEETNSRGPLLGDGTTQRLRNALFNSIQSTADNVSSGNFERLVDVGISIGSGGDLELDSERLREALSEDPEAVEALFTTRVLVEQEEFEAVDGVEGVSVRTVFTGDEFSSLGIMGLIEQLTDRYTDSIDGILTNRTNSLGDQIEGQQDRIDELNIRLESQRTRLERDYASLELALSDLQSSQSALASLG